MQRISAVGISLLGISLGTAVSFAQRVASLDLVQEEPVLVGVESNGFVDASAAMRMAEAAISNSVESAELDAAQAELAAPAVDRLLPQSEEQRTFQRANGGKYIEIASGLNYQDEAGAWNSSRVSPKTQANGSVTFDELPVKHTFAPWSGQRVVVESSRRGGPVAKSALGGLSYYDLSSGKSALIAWVTNSPVQAYDGGVFYERAFLGVDADILYKVHPWGLEQDVVIFGGLPDPKAFGMDPAQTKLCALTELVDFNLGQAGVERSGDVAPAEPAVASLEVSTKQGADWKRLYNWQPGYAYPEEGTLMVGAGDAGDQAHPVAMRLFSAMGRVFLSEEVPVSHVSKSMPELLDAQVQDGVVRVENIQEQNPLALPPVRSDEKLVADRSPSFGPQAYIRRSPRYVLDYINYYGTNTTGITFASGQTYYISAPLIVSGGKVVIQPNAVVKLATGACVQIQGSASLDCRSHAANPAYFTSAYDTNLGEVVLSGASPVSNRYNKGIYFNLPTTTNEVKGVLFRYAKLAIFYYASGVHSIRDVQILDSEWGVQTYGYGTNDFRNVLIRNCANGVQLYSHRVMIENFTFHSITNRAIEGWYITTNISVKNSIFYDVKTAFFSNSVFQTIFAGNAAYNVTTGWMGSGVVTLASNTFAIGAYGSNYLVVGSAAINAGTTNADLLGLYHYTTATNGLKETNSLVDIGFHYGTAADQDGDGMPDYLEDRSGDGSYASNSTDISDWNAADTDGDGLSDSAEFFTHGTNPKSTDTDNDGLSDALEVQNGSNPLDAGSTLWSLSGTVSYTGIQTGTLHVLVTSYEPLTNRPAMDYSFDEDRVGYTPDISGSGREGTIYGATWKTNGVKGGCYTFDGNDRITLGGLDAANGSSALTWTAWMRYTGGGVLGGLLGNTTNNNESIMLMKGGENLTAYVVPQSRTQERYAQAGGLVTQGIWQLVSGTYDGTQTRLYLNGDLVATGAVYSTEPIHSNSLNASIGDVSDGRGWYFYGDLDEVRIYKSTFTTNQMKSLFFEIGGSVIRRTWTTNVLATSSAFAIPNLPSGSNYWITAWRDANGNGRMDHWEAQGRYSGYVGNLGGNSNSLSVTLADPDLDGDGVGDGVEIMSGTDPRSTNSVPVTAAGEVSYSGGQTGPIYITARPYETITDTPLLRYSFNTSNSTIVLDESGNGITGILSNAKWTSGGIRNGAYRFDGNANINLGDLSAVEGRTGLTWGAWVNQAYGSSLRGIMGKMVSYGESFLLVSTPSSGSLNAQVVPQSRAQARDAAVNGVATGMVWQYVAGTYDGQQTRLYLDGQLIATSPVYAVEGIFSNNTVAAVGDVAVGRGWYMNGRLDDVHIYGRCFNTNEMYSLAASIRPENSIRVITNAQPGAFAFTNLPNARKYWFEAYRDSNGNGQRDSAEAWVVWSNNPAFLQTGTTNVNLTLIDTDTDQDGMPDWWEILYGLNLTSSIPGAGEGWWKFDETSGTNAANSAGSGYGGQLVNMGGSSWVTGVLGRALQFNGSSGYVRIVQSPAIITGQQFSVSAWAWLDSTFSADFPTVLSDFRSCGWSYQGFWLGYDRYAPGPELLVGDCSGYVYPNSTQAITGKWVHVVGTYEGSTAVLYVDGVGVASAASSFMVATQSEVRIGWSHDPSYTYHWKGQLDDVRLYKTALSSNAVATMYDALADGDGDGIANAQEYQMGTSPNNQDSDGDGLVDGADGRVTTSSYPQGADTDSDGYVDGENDYGTSPWKYDSDGDGLVDGKDGLIGITAYVNGIDADHDGYVDGELDSKTNPLHVDTDGDGRDDGFEVRFGLNPTNTLGTTGVNSNWIFHSQSDYARGTWEQVPGLWQRFLMVDYQAGTNTAYFLAPQQLGLDAACTTQIQLRSSWLNGSSWPQDYFTGTLFTNTVISSDRPFHGLPTMGQVTLSVYRIQWPIPSLAQTNATTAYYAPLVKILTNSVQSGYAWILDRMSASGDGYGYNNYLASPQATGPQYGGNDFNADMDKIRFRNGGFESGSTLYHTNEPFWGGFGYDGAISTSIVHGGVRSFRSHDVDGMYQRVVVHAGEELVLGGWMYTPSTTNATDTNALTSSRYGLVSIEYYSATQLDALQIAGVAITSTNAKDIWQYFAVTSLVPAQADYAQISLRTVAPTMNLVPPGHVYYDDISLAASGDADQDGMPDRWEVQWPAILSTNVPSDAIADPDGDGLFNVEEYREGTNPANGDSDGDGLSDSWEISFGLNPLDPADAAKDLDGDGLSSIQEKLLGTDPLRWDTDGDGLDDATEALDVLASPIVADFGGFTLQQELDGSAATQQIGSWSQNGAELCAADLRGALTYQFNVPTGDVYRVELEGGDCAAWQIGLSYEIRMVLDGLYLGRQMLVGGTNGAGVVGLFTPWISGGVHTVRFEWDNASMVTRLNVKKVRLMRLNGPDSDGDGAKDWVENRLARLSGLDTNVITSLISPACVEGRDPYPSLMNVGSVTSSLSIGGRWFANVPLNASSTVSQVFRFQNSGLVHTGLLTWSATDLLSPPANPVLRVGDALRFTCCPAGATSGSFAVSVVGVTNYSVRPVGGSIVHAFAESGTYLITGTNYPASGPIQAGTLTVRVYRASFDDSPAVWAGVSRAWLCTNLPFEVVLQADSSVLLSEQPLLPVRTFALGVDVPENHGLVARLGAGGPIMAATVARGFRFAADLETGIEAMGVCGTGTTLFENPFVLSPTLADLSIKCDVIRSGVLFSDGTLSKTFTATNFSANGVLGVRFIRDAATQGAFCNNVDIYQGTNILGRHVSP